MTTNSAANTISALVSSPRTSPIALFKVSSPSCNLSSTTLTRYSRIIVGVATTVCRASRESGTVCSRASTPSRSRRAWMRSIASVVGSSPRRAWRLQDVDALNVRAAQLGRCCSSSSVTAQADVFFRRRRRSLCWARVCSTVNRRSSRTATSAPAVPVARLIWIICTSI